MDSEKRVFRDKQRTEFTVTHVSQTVKIIKHLLSWKKSAARRYLRTITKQQTEYASKRPPFVDPNNSTSEDPIENFDPAKHHPVFYGVKHKSISIDDNAVELFDPAVSHPACVGYSLLPVPPPEHSNESCKLPDKQKCTAREYLEHYIFPTLLPALEAMLAQAKVERCFERKRTKFNALDFLTEYLYSNNPRCPERAGMKLADIDFVQEWWKDHPRPPLANSVLWNEAQASLIIQSFFRGYKIRREPEIAELRSWQLKWREELDIKNRVSDFWQSRMPSSDKDEEEEVQQSPASVN